MANNKLPKAANGRKIAQDKAKATDPAPRSLVGVGVGDSVDMRRPDDKEKLVKVAIKQAEKEPTIAKSNGEPISSTSQKTFDFSNPKVVPAMGASNRPIEVALKQTKKGKTAPIADKPGREGKRSHFVHVAGRNFSLAPKGAGVNCNRVCSAAQL